MRLDDRLSTLPRPGKAVALVSLLLALALPACGDDDTTDTGATTPPAATETAPTETTAKEPSPGKGCRGVEPVAPRADGGERRPRKALDAGKTYTATVKTNCGSFTFELDLGSAPKTAASFVALAKNGFYEGTVFHRIVPGFVIQGGDPTGTGTGGPGYKTVDKPPRSARYTRGVVAMAKGGDEKAGTSGSQFFVVTGRDAGLPADYALLGKVTKGLPAVLRIGKLGDPATQQATGTIMIQRISIRSS